MADLLILGIVRPLVAALSTLTRQATIDMTSDHDTIRTCPDCAQKLKQLPLEEKRYFRVGLLHSGKCDACAYEEPCRDQNR